MFMEVSHLTVKAISFLDCGHAIPNDVYSEAIYIQTSTYMYFFEKTKAALFLVNIQSFSADHLFINNSDGFGLFGLNILGNSRIVNSVFSYNNHRALSRHDSKPQLYCRAAAIENTTSCSGGNAVIIFQDTPYPYRETPVYNLVISRSNFSQGSNLDYQDWDGPIYYVYPAGGLSIFTGQVTYSINVLVSRVIIDYNIGHNAGNMVVYMHDNYGANSDIRVEYTQIIHGNSRSTFFSNVANSGGIYVYYGESSGYYCVSSCPTVGYTTSKTLSFFDSLIFRNYGFWAGAVFVDSVINELKETIPEVLFHGCNISENFGYDAIVRVIEYYIGLNSDGILYSIFFELKSTTIEYNKRQALEFRDNTKRYFIPPAKSAVHFATLQHSRINNCTIADNDMQGLYVNKLNTEIAGDTYVLRNTGVKGGGIGIFKGKIKIAFSSHLYIEGNAGTMGGGLYIDNLQVPLWKPGCFFDTEIADIDKFINNGRITNDLQVVFSNNTATFAGNSIYGGYVDFCSTALEMLITGLDLFQQIFTIPWNNSLTEVTSNIHQLCFCKNMKPECGVTSWKTPPLFPGQTFQVPVVAVGQLNGTIPSVAISRISQAYSAKLDPRQDAQQLGVECGDLNYRLSTNESLVEIELLTNYEKNQRPLDAVILTVEVALEVCPLGFTIDEDSEVCVCIPFLKDRGIICIIDSVKFVRSAPVWIGYIQDNHCELILAHNTCPLDYCKTTAVEFALNTTDLECAFNHSGILCGGCQDGLSSIFGSSRCKRCSNGYLALILVYIIVGFGLVCLLIFTDLTVSHGTINGLIFYANIVRVNHNILFPQGHTNILTVFIAWLNLDLGIEVCFYDGLDGYGRTWLQFLFPIYIWIIIGIIIATSHRHPFAARLAGTNAVAVLATLLLLSYAKLQRTILEAFSFTFVSAHNSTSFPVWLYDGNIKFLGAKHAALFVAAAIAALGFIVPFTALVLLGPVLQARCGTQMVKYKLKPILDHFQGPYEVKFRWWTGVMLLVRTLLLLAFAVNVLGSPRLNLLFIVTAVTVLLGIMWNLGPIYQKWWVNALESFHLINLGLFAAWTEFNRQGGANFDKNQAIISYLFVGVTFLVFAVVLGCHILAKFNERFNFLGWCSKLKSKVRKSNAYVEMEEEENEEEETPEEGAATVTYENFELTRVRESLLSEDSTY